MFAHHEYSNVNPIQRILLQENLHNPLHGIGATLSFGGVLYEILCTRIAYLSTCI